MKCLKALDIDKIRSVFTHEFKSSESGQYCLLKDQYFSTRREMESSVAMQKQQYSKFRPMLLIDYFDGEKKLGIDVTKLLHDKHRICRNCLVY